MLRGKLGNIFQPNLSTVISFSSKYLKQMSSGYNLLTSEWNIETCLQKHFFPFVMMFYCFQIKTVIKYLWLNTLKIVLNQPVHLNNNGIFVTSQKIYS